MARADAPDPPGSRLGQRRRDAGLSQRELARLTGISLSTIQRIERGEVANPKIKLLANCAIVVGCGIDDLIEPAWREWWPAGGPAPPTAEDVQAARDASFRPSPGRPVREGWANSGPSEPRTVFERQRRERISDAMKRHWAKKKAEQDHGAT